MGAEPWYRDGLRFECTACGACCRTCGEWAYVYVAARDAAAIAAHLGIDRERFAADFCDRDGGWLHLKMPSDDCVFLDSSGRCRVYPVRPRQCASWPFWTENLDRETWEGPISARCPGVGRGRLYSAEEIERIARERDEWYGIQGG